MFVGMFCYIAMPWFFCCQNTSFKVIYVFCVFHIIMVSLHCAVLEVFHWFQVSSTKILPNFKSFCLSFSALMTFMCIILIPKWNNNIGKLFTGLLLSYCSRFCNLIALLWVPTHHHGSLSLMEYLTGPDVMWIFIIALFFISSVRVYQGTKWKLRHDCASLQLCCLMSALVYNCAASWVR